MKLSTFFRRAALALALSFVLVSVQSLVFADEPEPQVVTKKTALFNGRNLDGWSVFIGGEEPGTDPNNVFTVEDGAIHISGNGVGGITTDKAYRDYQLIIEFKWGDKAWKNRVNCCRDGGVLIHSVGEAGAFGGCWYYSIEANIIEGGLGDFIVVGDGSDNYAITVNVKPEKSKEGAWIYDPNGEPQRVTANRVDWYARDPDWKDVRNFRGKDDFDKPLGEWNELKLVCNGDKVDVYVNGHLVNQAYDVKPSAGRIQFQTELAEYFIRKIELLPLENKNSLRKSGKSQVAGASDRSLKRNGRKASGKRGANESE